MKRPFGVYLVAIWFLFGFGSFTWTPITRTYLPKLINDPKIIQLIATVGLFFIIYNIVGIIRMRSVPLMITAVIFIMLSVSHIVTSLMYIASGNYSNINIILFKLSLLLFSIISVIYLLRPSFRIFQKKYVEEKRQEAHAKWVQKNAAKFNV